MELFQMQGTRSGQLGLPTSTRVGPKNGDFCILFARHLVQPSVGAMDLVLVRLVPVLVLKNAAAGRDFQTPLPLLKPHLHCCFKHWPVHNLSHYGF